MNGRRKEKGKSYRQHKQKKRDKIRGLKAKVVFQ